MHAKSSRTAVFLAVALAFGVSACASSGGSSSSRPAGATQNRIVRAELVDLGPLDGFQAVQRLRPRWMQGRSGTAASPILYVDGARRSSLQDLQSIRAQDVEQMEFMSASDATTRFGTDHTGGAIMVQTRR